MSETGRMHGRPVIYGEVLFDQFEDGASVLGGAPFNVAWHLQGFGAAPLFISRIGNDEPGGQVLEAMCQWGMETAGVQRDPVRPTGAVAVSLRDGQPSYTILDQQAYDAIDLAAARAAIGEAPLALLYHGSLALRHAPSRLTLDGLRQLGAPLFVDINLRAPWWQWAQIEPLLRRAHWLKLNDEELGELCTVAGLGPLHCDALPDAAETLRRRFGLASVVVTRGAQGAFIATEAGIVDAAPVAVRSIADTVGAGDAFSAVTLLGQLRGWPLPTTLERALAFAAELCTRRGATPKERGLYTDFLQQWGEH